MGRVLGIILLFVLAAGEASFAKDGMPSPWPFPWAKECPMAWEKLSGRYRMSGSNARDEIRVRVVEGDSPGTMEVLVKRLTARGRARAVGLAIVPISEREFSVHMFPMTRKDGPETWITIRMYYASEAVDCDMTSLVPIMTVSQGNQSREESDYVLIRLEPVGGKK